MTPFLSRFPALATLISALFFAILALGVRKLGQSGMSAVEVLFYRSLIPTLMLAPVAWRERSEASTMTGTEWRAFGLRAVAGAAAIFTYFLAILWSPISLASLTSNTSPLWTVALAAVWLGEKPPRRMVWCLPMALVGCAILAAHKDPSAANPEKFGQGLAVGLLSAALAAFANVNIRRLRRVPASWVALSLTLTAMLGVLPFLPVHAWRLSGPQVGWIGLLGFAGSVAQYTLTVGYQYNRASIASTLGLTAAPFATLIGYFFLSETLDPAQWLGMAIVLAATALISMTR